MQNSLGDATLTLNSVDTNIIHDVSNGSNIISTGWPRATLVCRPNSHPFQERNLQLDQSIKIGRSVARARPSATNAIFDCKVLSRNHALIWYETGKFYLQDTKSSNGTFVNNQRLSKGSEESLPREVCSGDILQFGVDVMENSRKVTHGCIIATLKLFLPDGKEAKASPTIVSTPPHSLPTQDLYQLNQYIQEALAREQMLENKLALLQRLVGQTGEASEEAWKSLIDEDRLLTRVEILESQLSTYGKAMTEDKLREETQRLMGEKELYQETAKETLKKLVDEKLEAVKKQKELEKALSNTEDEYGSLKELYEKYVQENRELALQVNRLRNELEEEIAARQKLSTENGSEKPQQVEDGVSEVVLNGDSRLSTDEKGQKSGSSEEEKTDTQISTEKTDSIESFNSNNDESILISEENTDPVVQNGSISVCMANDITMESKDSNDITCETDSIDSCQQDSLDEDAAKNNKDKELNEKISNLESELNNYKNKYEILVNNSTTTDNALLDAQNKLKEVNTRLEQKDSDLSNMEIKLQETSKRMQEEILAAEKCKNDATEFEQLRSQLAKLTSEKETLANDNKVLKDNAGKYESLLKECQESVNDKSQGRLETTGESDIIINLEKSLNEANNKISELLKVKEKYAEVDLEKTNLGHNLSELEEEMDVLSFQTRTATAFSVVPLGILLLAIMVAYLPYLSSLFGTVD